jgi:hypothetical protein
MITEYINPRQPFGDLFLSAVQKPSLKLIEPEEGEVLTDAERRSNLTTIVEYATTFVTSMEVKKNPLFSPEYIENFAMVTRILSSRDLPTNENFKTSSEHFEAIFSQMRFESEDFYERAGSIIDSTEEAFGISVTEAKITQELRDLVATGYAILWGSYKIAKGENPSTALSLMSQSVNGALKGAMVSNYKGILGGAIVHALTVKNFDSREAQVIFANSVN